MKKVRWQVVVIAVFVLAACLYMAGDWVYRNVPMGMELVFGLEGETLEEQEANFDRVRLMDLPVYDHLAFEKMEYYPYVDPVTGEETAALFVKRGSPYTLRYWHTLMLEKGYSKDQLPPKLVYVEHSFNEAMHYWREIRSAPNWDAFMYWSFRMTGGLMFDQEHGYYVDLIIEGKDADRVWETLRAMYGDFVQESQRTLSDYRHMQYSPELASYWLQCPPMYREPSLCYEE